LALWQASYVAEAIKKEHPSYCVELRELTTKGDRILDAPLAKIGGKGLFTKELEQAMLDGAVDLAVHSLKDMPTEVPDGLVIGAITTRLDPGDAFVSAHYAVVEDLPVGARVGTSSLRRRAQLLAVRPDLTICDLRGNVNTRLAKLDAGEFDAIVLAAAGLKRLGFERRIRSILPRSVMLPAVGQGALAIECRAGDTEILSTIAFLRDAGMTTAAQAERARNEAQSKLEAQREVNDTLQVEINRKEDLDHIRDLAVNRYGMVQPGQDQIRYYKRVEQGYVRQYENIPKKSD